MVACRQTLFRSRRAIATLVVGSVLVLAIYTQKQRGQGVNYGAEDGLFLGDTAEPSQADDPWDPMPHDANKPEGGGMVGGSDDVPNVPAETDAAAAESASLPVAGADDLNAVSLALSPPEPPSAGAGAGAGAAADLDPNPTADLDPEPAAADAGAADSCTGKPPLWRKKTLSLVTGLRRADAAAPQTTGDGAPTPAAQRNAVRAAMNHTWATYKLHAFGFDEIRPMSCGTGDDLGGIGATLIDSMDTLFIMGFHDEFKAAKQWTVENLLGRISNKKVHFFETTIRVVGGLLSAYDLSGDKHLLDAAKTLVTKMLPTFETTSGMPQGYVHTGTGEHENPGWTGGMSLLAEVGTCQMEYFALSARTCDGTFFSKADHAAKLLSKWIEQHPGQLVPSSIDVGSGEPRSGMAGMGALSDSYYEYLLKVWLLGTPSGSAGGAGVAHYLKSWRSTVAAMSAGYVSAMPDGGAILKQSGNGQFEHLACFVPGMLTLGYMSLPKDDPKRDEYLALGKRLAKTCARMYTDQSSGLSPDSIQPDQALPNGYRVDNSEWKQRPETVETLFYLWRATKEPIYREIGWKIFSATNQLKSECGYASWDVSANRKIDKQQTFWTAETLKYLYLLFCDDDVMPLDEWVFNTEAHPLHRGR